ncbi:antitermination regulator, partial [Streptomyces tuirus]
MDWQKFAEDMALLARRLLKQDSVQQTLDEIAASAV